MGLVDLFCAMTVVVYTPHLCLLKGVDFIAYNLYINITG